MASDGQRRWAKDPGSPGPPVFNRAKLTAKQRDEIADRLEADEDPMELALEFGVSASTIRSMRRRKR